MKTLGVALGALMVGGAVIAISKSSSASSTAVEGCTFSNATNYNPDATVDNGSCLFAKPEDTKTYKKQKEEQQKQKQRQEETAGISCSNYSEQDSQYREKLDLATSGVSNAYATTHDLIGLKAKVGVNKTKYVVGEPIIVYIVKSRHTSSLTKGKKWEKWGGASSFGGESSSMTMKVQSNDEIFSLFNGSVLNTANTSNYNPLSGSTRDTWSFRQMTLDTSTIQITEPTQFKIYAKINMNDGKRTKEKTVESAFTLYPAGCAKTQNAESFSSEEEIMSFQSFVYPW